MKHKPELGQYYKERDGDIYRVYRLPYGTSGTVYTLIRVASMHDDYAVCWAGAYDDINDIFDGDDDDFELVDIKVRRIVRKRKA